MLITNVLIYTDVRNMSPIFSSPKNVSSYITFPENVEIFSSVFLFIQMI